jgi:hypothetical protein
MLMSYWLKGVETAKEASELDNMNVVERSRMAASQSAALGVRKYSPLDIIKFLYFSVLVILTVTLYILYELNVSEDPAYMQTPTSVKSSKSRPLLGLVITVGILLLAYAFTFGLICFRNFVYLRSLTLRSRTLFLFNLLMCVITVCTLLFGVYSPYYANGQAFVFFLALLNLYVWTLLFFHWPMGWEGGFMTGLSNAPHVSELEMQQVRQILESDVSKGNDISQIEEVTTHNNAGFKGRDLLGGFGMVKQHEEAKGDGYQKG